MRAYLAEINELPREERERLILEQLPQVNLIARRLHDRLPGSVSLDDLVSTGVVGLISAIDNFDPSQGVKLKTYAEYKIRGAILDSLRGLDWASRYRRKKAKQIEAAICKAEQKLQRMPTEDEVADEMGLSLADYQARLVEVQGLNLESLEVTVGPSGEQTLLSLVPDGEELPSETYERLELERLLAAAIDEMPEVEKTILALYYQEELTLREISDILDMRISRISELKSHCVMKLRSRMREQWPVNRGR